MLRRMLLAALCALCAAPAAAQPRTLPHNLEAERSVLGAILIDNEAMNVAAAVIDPKAMTVTARMGKPAGSGALRFTKKGVWTTAHDVHTLTWWPRAILKGR